MTSITCVLTSMLQLTIPWSSSSAPYSTILSTDFSKGGTGEVQGRVNGLNDPLEAIFSSNSLSDSKTSSWLTVPTMITHRLSGLKSERHFRYHINPFNHFSSGGNNGAGVERNDVEMEKYHLLRKPRFKTQNSNQPTQKQTCKTPCDNPWLSDWSSFLSDSSWCRRFRFCSRICRDTFPATVPDEFEIPQNFHGLAFRCKLRRRLHPLRWCDVPRMNEVCKWF